MATFNNKFCLVKTPMRISLSGGGTDFPGLFPNIKFGSVLSFAINFYVYTSVRILDPAFHKYFRIEYSSNELTETVYQIKNNIVRGVLTKLNWDKIVQINVVSDIPGGSGLGGSSVFCVSLVHALQYLRGMDTSPNMLAKISNEVELKTLCRSMGIQDALPAAYGGLSHYRLYSLDNVEVTKITNPILTKYICDNIYLIWTGQLRNSESILKGQLSQLDKHLDLYKRLRDLTESLVIKISNEKDADVIHFNLEQTIKASHKIKIEIANGLISKYSQSIINKLISINVNGYRIVGAGNGGFILALVHPNKREDFRQKFSNVQFIKPVISRLGSFIQHFD